MANKPTVIQMENLQQEIEASRKLKSRLVEEAINRFPFKELKEVDITPDKIEKYITILEQLKTLYETEEKLWENLS